MRRFLILKLKARWTKAVFREQSNRFASPDKYSIESLKAERGDTKSAWTYAELGYPRKQKL